MAEPLPSPDALVPPSVDTLPINFALLDDEGWILWTNRAWREFAVANDTAARPDSIGENYLTVTRAADEPGTDEIATALEDLLAGEREHLEVEYPCHSPAERRWFTMRAAPFEFAGERFVAVAHTDVTELVESRLATERFVTAIEAAGHSIFITDLEGRIWYVNPAFERMTGYSESEALGRTPAILSSGEHEDAFYADLWETILAGESWEGEIVNRRKSGDPFLVNASIVPVLDEAGEPVEFVAVQHEITDLKELRQQLQAQDDILRHDLRTKLTLILGYVDLIADAEADDRDPAHLAAVRRAAEDLLGTAEKARALRRFLERTSHPEPIDVAALARRAVEQVRESNPGADVVVDVPAAATALAVPEFADALSELLENAIVHADVDPPRVELTVREIDAHVCVTVADEGPGIPPMEYTPRHPEIVTPLEHGQGIGLDMVYWITRRSGGRFAVEDREPRGSTVIVELPRPAT